MEDEDFMEISDKVEACTEGARQEINDRPGWGEDYIEISDKADAYTEGARQEISDRSGWRVTTAWG